jgi:CBS domain containing-hemolysin-like protein
MEIAFVSANRLKLEMVKKQGNLTSGIINIFASNPEQYITTMLVGNNIALVIYGLAFARLLEPSLASFFQSDIIVLLAQTIISTTIILITGEFIPKVLFKINSIGVLKALALPVLLFYILLFPIANFAMYISKFIIRKIFRKDFSASNEELIFTRVDLDHYVNQMDQQHNESDKKEDETEIKLFKNALDFSKVKVRDCMVPRTEIDAVEEDTSIEALKSIFISTGFSKILIYRDSIDNMIGYVHSSQMFTNPENIKSIINELPIVPETMTASNLLSLFTQKRRTIAVVVDEFGGTSGLVTTEDILEEIFGEIEDEHDTDDLTFKKIKENEWIISARHEISKLNELHGYNLPESEAYDTLAGLILTNHEDIPKPNTLITINNYEFRILKATDIRIELVLMKDLEKI